jgi:Glycosyl hydrolase-like 10
MQFLRSFSSLFSRLMRSRVLRSLVIVCLVASLIISSGWHRSVAAQMVPSGSFCQLSSDQISQKDSLRARALEGDRGAQNDYKSLVSRHAQDLRQCRNQSWLRNQAIWLRLYPCDARPGKLDELMDRIVERGYNQVYVEVFANGQVLLPQADNPTVWPSLLRLPGYGDRDLLAEAIAKGRERGLQVYAWMFSLNFGYVYGQRSGAEQTLARNGAGQSSNTVNTAAGLSTDIGEVNTDETFVDPYNPQAKRDYYNLVQAVVRRQPDGVLFDYIRYPRGTGAASIASRVKDLWIYGSAAQQALYARATNPSGEELIRRFVNRGYITADDIASVSRLYPQERPQWQGITPFQSGEPYTPTQMQPYYQSELWRLSVAHAIQGVLDFLSMAILPVQQRNIPAGAVFFPDGNRAIGQGFDSRLQPWDRFPTNIEWHPMTYGTCGNASCIVSQLQEVVEQAAPGAKVMPVLAGIWGQSISGRPSLEAQMQAIHYYAPQITAISHFAYSWQFPESDRERKFCRL